MEPEPERALWRARLLEALTPARLCEVRLSHDAHLLDEAEGAAYETWSSTVAGAAGAVALVAGGGLLLCPARWRACAVLSGTAGALALALTCEGDAAEERVRRRAELVDRFAQLDRAAKLLLAYPPRPGSSELPARWVELLQEAQELARACGPLRRAVWTEACERVSAGPWLSETAGLCPGTDLGLPDRLVRTTRYLAYPLL